MINNRIRLSSRIGSALVVLLAISCLSCSRQENGAREVNTRVFTDDLGRSVYVPETVESVVSLAPNLTEIIFAVGAGEKLVGVTTFCDYPAEAKAIRKVSDTQKPNIESIIALKPQVVFVSTASQLEAFTKTLEEQKISVFVTSPNTLEDIYASIEKIGQITGNEQTGGTLVQSLKDRVGVVRRLTATGAPPKVFVQIDKESLYTVGRDSYIDDLISQAGGFSATADLATAYPKISKESALAMNPDVIIISESDGNREPNEVFRNSPAVKNGRVYMINADLLSRPGPRVVDALEMIAGRLMNNKE